MAERQAVDDEIADVEWVKWLERTHPGLVGQIGRLPTRREKRLWERRANARRNKDKLIKMKYAYLLSRRKDMMLRYLDFRRSLGYIEGVLVPDWLLTVGHKKRQKRGLVGGGGGRVVLNSEPESDGVPEVVAVPEGEGSTPALPDGGLAS